MHCYSYMPEYAITRQKGMISVAYFQRNSAKNTISKGTLPRIYPAKISESKESKEKRPSRVATPLGLNYMHACTTVPSWPFPDKPPTRPFLVQPASPGRHTASSIRAGSAQLALIAAVAMLQGPRLGKLVGRLGRPSSEKIPRWSGRVACTGLLMLELTMKNIVERS
jgi:hypothetical protein